MNGVLPSLCLLGATLATANMFIMQRPTCHSPASNVAVAGSDVPSLKTVVLDIGKADPANAPIRPKPPVRPKDVDVSGSVEQSKEANAAVGKDAASTKTEVVSTAKAEAAVSAGEDVTGSVKQTKKTDPKQSAQAEWKLHDGPTYARPRRRGYGWRWDWYPPPPAAFGMRVYPGW